MTSATRTPSHRLSLEHRQSTSWSEISLPSAGAAIPATRTSSPIAWGVVLQRSLIPLALLALRIAPGPLKPLSYPLLALYSLGGRRQAILSLFLLFLFNTWTHAFGAPPAAAALFRHINVLTAGASVMLIHVSRKPRSSIPSFLWCTAAMSTVLIIHSAAVSTFPEISVLKAIAFVITIQTLLVAWSSLTPRERALTQLQILAMLSGIAVLSLPLARFPFGYLREQPNLFKGLLQHSQIFGPTMGYLAAWLAASWLADRRYRSASVGLLGAALLCVYWSSSRVGLAVFLAGMAAALLAGPLRKVLSGWRRGGGVLQNRLWIGIVVLSLTALLTGPRLYERAAKFLRKGRTDEATVVDVVVSARQFMIDRMKANISQRPLSGIGFGVPSDLRPEDRSGFSRDPIFGLPIMATVEKGVLPVAMVEEMGFPLASLYFLWMTGLFCLATLGGPVPAALCAASIATGIGEASFFSPGGSGMLPIVLATMSATWPRDIPNSPVSKEKSRLATGPVLTQARPGPYCERRH